MAKQTANAAKAWTPQVGCWITTPNPWACEIAAAIGYTAILIDREHGTIGNESMDSLIALGRSLGLAVHVRVSSPDRVPIQQALDAGAHGLILPQVRDLAHARAGAGYAKYPPLGLRGMGTPRSLNYGDTPGDFVEEENRRTRCYVMIETPGALRDVARICALEAVDGVFMGPYDLSLTRGRGQYRATSADVADARRIGAAAAKARKSLAMPVGDRETLGLARSWAADLISIAEDLSALKLGLHRTFTELMAGATAA